MGSQGIAETPDIRDSLAATYSGERFDGRTSVASTVARKWWRLEDSYGRVKTKRLRKGEERAHPTFHIPWAGRPSEW